MDDISRHYFEVGGVGLLPSLYRTFFLMVHVLYVELFSGQTQFRITVRRICIYFILFCVLPALIVWNHVGLYLDDIFFDDWRACEIDSPLFIVGNARSGTTWFHGLITNIVNGNNGNIYEDASTSPYSNPPRFTTFRTWEILFAVSITWKLLMHRAHALDKSYLGGAMVRTLALIEDRLLGDAGMRERYVHPIGLMNVEEDEWLMMHIGCSQLILFFFPLGSALLHPLIMFDDYDDTSSSSSRSSSSGGAQLSASTRRMVFAYYKDCVRRHLYFFRKLFFATPAVATTMDHHNHHQQQSSQHEMADDGVRRRGRRVIFVSKNPAFTLRLDTLLDTFPDARLICLVRAPQQSIPSMISYISTVWHLFSSPTSQYPNAKDLLGFCERHYLYPLQVVRLRALSPARFAFVSYHRLLTHLEETLLHVLDQLYPPSSPSLSMNEPQTPRSYQTALRSYLQSEQARASNFNRHHMHSLAECCNGMTAEELRTTLAAVYEHHKDLFPT